MRIPLQIFTILAMAAATTSGFAQSHLSPNAAARDSARNKVIVITGARFSYALIQRWIDNYHKTDSNAQFVIEPRGAQDPGTYDILVEAFEPTEKIRGQRQYTYVARYAVLPVANASSAFAGAYSSKGLTAHQIKQLFFYDPFADQEKRKTFTEPYTVYTRLQKAGASTVFASHYGFQQQDIKGKAVAGSDEHLYQAIVRDSLAVAILPLSVIYDPSTRKVRPGLAILPVDLDANGKVTEYEKFYDDLDRVLAELERTPTAKIKGLALAQFHFSVSKDHPDPDAVAFIRWVVSHGLTDLHHFGFMLNAQHENTFTAHE